MEETERLFACEFCRVKSYLAVEDVFRYMLANNAGTSKDIVFFPFWRFKGMLFACAGNGIRHQFVDVSNQAIVSQLFPVSLGLRSQALKLKFVTPETRGRFLKPTQTLADVEKKFDNRFGKSLPKPVIHYAHIGETISLIYAPFYFDNRLHDAVLNRPIATSRVEDSDIDSLPIESPHWRIHFISTLCPDCGWDLEGEKDSLVLLCKNCTSAWYPVGRKLKKIRFSTQTTSEGQAVYLPFWSIRPEISGFSLNHYADLVQVANIPRVVQPGWKDIGFRFWVPAFKIRPKIFLQLSKNMTLSQLYNGLTEKLPENRHHPITLPVTEAIESLKVNLASFIKPKNRLIDILRGIDIKAKTFVLVYVPFLEKHHELIQPDLRFAINKNTIALSENL